MSAPKNMAASVTARLKNIAKAEQRNFDELLTMFMLERLLYRISKSRYRDRLILKGGLLLCVLMENYETFQRRRTPYETNPDIFSPQFLAQPDKQKQWSAFCRRTLTSHLDLADVLARVGTLLEPIYQSILEEREFFGAWCKDQKRWL